MISKLIVRTKTERFDVVRILSEQKQNISFCSKNYLKTNQNVLAIFLSFITKLEQNRVNLLSIHNISIHLGFRANKTKLI
jgi:hypothetical protein